MKKRVLLVLVLIFTLTSVGSAAYFEFLPYTIYQPDGTIISCFVSGDEFFNWLHDKDGYTIIQGSDGYYYYGEQDGDVVKPTKYIVNSVIPGSKGLARWIGISQKEYQRRRDVMFQFEKEAKGGPVYAPRTGTFNNLVIFIRFSDDSEFTATRQTFDDKFNLTTGVALKSYYNEVSFGNLTISSTTYPVCASTTNLSFQDSHPRSYFQPYNASTNTGGYNNDTEKTTREHTLLVAAVNWINANSPVPASLNIDADGDNNIDNICFIIRGSNGAWNDLLWAHRWALYTQTVSINGKRVYDYNFEPESQVSVTTLCHEMFHSIGGPDLYHYTNQGVIAPAGRWDIMDGGSGHMLTYMKWKYTGNLWISSIPSITSNGTYTLQPATSSTNNCYKIASPNSASQYFVVEYRNKSGTFETNVPGSGLIVYRIDPTRTGNSSGPPDEVYVYRPGGTTTANGTPNNAFFSSAAGRTAINDATDPKCFLQDGSAGGLSISNVTSAGTTISFTVTFPNPPNSPAANAATNILQTSFVANWTGLVTASGYRLDVSSDPSFTTFVTGYNNLDLGNVINFTVTGLNAKTVYYYRLRAYNLGGTSSNSSSITLKTLTIPSSVPANLSASSCNDLITLKWRKSTGADFLRYRIYSGTVAGTMNRSDSTINGIADTSKIIYGLSRGQTYNYNVSAVNTDGVESNYSNISSAIVKTGVIPRIKTKWADVLICYNLLDSVKSYQWYKSGAVINGETSQFYKTDKKSGAYLVQTVDLNGCKNSSSPITFPLPASGVNPVLVYPNPASDNITLKITDESEGKVTITVLNYLGTRVLYLQTEKAGSELVREIPITGLPNGIYQVRVNFEDEFSYSTQIIIAR